MYHKDFAGLASRGVAALIAAGLISCLAITPAVKGQTATSSRVIVTGQTLPTPTPDDTRPKLEHIMKEVSGTPVPII